MLRAVFLRDAHFLTCLIFLAAGAVAVQGLVSQGFRFSKERLDLKAPLTELDTQRILPYRLINSDRIPKEEVEALGTEEYIRWRLVDTSVSQTDPFRLVTLFVTYYSGQPDQVPHVPEECFLGGGYQRLSDDRLTMTIPELGEMGKEVPAKILRFRKDSSIGGTWVPAVVYLFSVNGRFVDSRTEVRFILSNPLDKYGYFSKVEVSFGHQEGSGDSQALRKAAERILGKVLPILVQSHWPDWPVRRASDNPGSSEAGLASQRAMKER